MYCTTASLLLLVATAVLAILLLNRLLWRTRGGCRLPPGPWGVPLMGNLPFLDPDLARYFADLSKAYGSVFSLRLGTELCVVISSASAAMEVFKVHDTVFANHFVPVVASIVLGGMDIAFTPYGPHWLMLRKVVVRELLSTTSIDSFRSLRQREMLRMVAELQPKAGDAVDIRSVAYSASLNVIMGMIWDDALKEGKTHSMAEKIRDAVEESMEVLGAPNISDFLPWLAPLDLQGLQRRARGLSTKFDAIFNSIIDHKVSNSVDEKGGVKDFLQLLLDLVKKGDPDVPLKPDHMRAIVLDIIIGGTDTTSTTVEWALSELMRNPEMMAKTQEELDAVVGNDCVLEESKLCQLHYLDAVVKETLRLHPIFPLLLPRAPSAACNVGGYTIPRGTRVFVNAWAIQRDPSAWEKPLEFRPERFMENEGRWGYNGKSFDYFPFGGGRRRCAGVNLAERMVMLLLGSLLHAFDWRLPHGTSGVELDGSFGIVYKKEEPLVLVPSIRTGRRVKQGVPLAS